MGFFLVVEGPEGAGKTTLVRGLAEQLRASGTDPVLVREPGGTPVAERIREVLLDPAHPVEPVSELFLFLAARADLIARIIRPALAAGRTLIADRFELSTQAYQCAGRGLDAGLFEVANAAATGGLRADLTLVLDLPAEVGFDRIRTGGGRLDRIEQAGAAFHARVGESFRKATGDGIVHLDATSAPERLLHLAWGELLRRQGGARSATTG